MRHFLLVSVLHVFVVVQTASAQRPGATPGPSRARTEVVLIAGGGHFEMYYNPLYSVAHIRALLTKIAPAAVGIENPPEWQEAGVQLHPDISEPKVVTSWARAAKVPVFGVRGDNDLQNWSNSALSLRAEQDSVPLERRKAQYKEGDRRRVAYQANIALGGGWTIAHMHSAKRIAEFQESRKRFADSVNVKMDHGDDDIAARIVRLARLYPGRRVAVIFGAFHYGPLVERLGKYPEVRLIPTEEFLPVTDLELERVWHRDDAIMMLGSNLDSRIARHSPQSRDHHRTKMLLDQLTAREPAGAATRYYRARWHMLLEEWEAARPLLEKISAGRMSDDVPFAPSPSWRWPPLPTVADMADFALGNLYDLQGDRARASELYRKLLERTVDSLLTPREQVNFYIDLRGYLQELIAQGYDPREESGRYAASRRAFQWSEAPENLRRLVRR